VRIDVQRFEDEGYLLVEDLLDPARDLDPVVQEYAAQLDQVAAEWHAQGKIASTYAELPFAQRFAHILNDAGPSGYGPFDITLSGKIDETTQMHLGPAVFGLITSPRLVDAVEQLIGSEVLSNPIQHVRIKPPEALLSAEFFQRNTMVSAVEWHQDQGVALPEVDETEMLTVWFPVMDATIENGCLCVIPESHKRGLLTHCPSRPGQAFDLRIPESIRGTNSLPVPMRRGSVLFLHRRTMHSSLRNMSDGVRWSFDLRYQPIGQPTGRPWFPSFVVRSRQSPASEIRDWRQWAGLWHAVRTHLAAHPEDMKPRRWTGTEPVCA
jgi:ectoine hydroxylase-related dioxygenase (phytanoyl-CoA dioxygenase family)